MEGKTITAVLKIKLSTDMEDVPENDAETVRYIVEQVLQDEGFAVDSVEVLEECLAGDKSNE